MFPWEQSLGQRPFIPPTVQPDRWGHPEGNITA